MKATQEAWQEFQRHYMPVELTPSYHGEQCLANGEHEVERRCDACDHWHTCYPEWPHIPSMKAEFIIRNCVANAHFEGQMCDEDDVAAIRRILSGETTLEAELEALEAKYRDMGLRPSYHGEDCPGNDSECPDCDWFETICFPDCRELEELGD